MPNLPKLKGKLREKGINYEQGAEIIGKKTITAFSNKMNGISNFYLDEADKIAKALELTPAERNEIFFED